MKVGNLKVSKGNFLKITWLGLDERVIDGKLMKQQNSFYIIGQVLDFSYKKLLGPVKPHLVPLLCFEILFSSYGYVKKGDKVELNIFKLNKDLLQLKEQDPFRLLKQPYPEWRFYYIDVKPISKKQALIYEL